MIILGLLLGGFLVLLVGLISLSEDVEVILEIGTVYLVTVVSVLAI